MDKKSRSSLNMQNTVTNLLDTYNDVLTADADLTAAEAVRQVHLGQARLAARRAAVQTPATTANKEAEKARVINDLLKPLGRVHAWAARTGNADVQAKADVSFTDLDGLPDGEVIGAMENLMTLMRGVVAQVATVPTATLDGLDNEIDALEPLLGATRSGIVDRTGAIAEFERELKAARLVLEQQHDKIVLSYEIAAPATPAEQRQRELFDRWDAARTIVDAATTHDTPAPSPAPAAVPPK
jgi:hypothetical protein